MTIIIMNFLEQYCHVITTIFLLSSSFSLFANTAAAQAASPVAQRAINENGNPSLAILLVVLVFAFFMTGFCAVYIRHCSETYVVPGTTAIGPRGIDPEVLSTFPIMVYSTVKHLKRGHNNVALQCAVCLSEFKDLDKLRLLPKCSHVFHPECIDAWLVSHVTCPVCRAKLKPEKGEFKVEIEEEGSENHVFDESSERRGEVFCEGDEGGVGGGVDRVVGKGNGLAKVGAFGVLVRSHSTGHSLVEPGKSFERFTLRLPEEARKQILDANNRSSGSMKRSASYDVVLQCGEGKGWWGRSEGCSGDAGEGSSKGKNNNRWVLSMTPPFVSRGWVSSLGVEPNECSTCSGIPRFWAASVAREEKECEGRAGLQVV